MDAYNSGPKTPRIYTWLFGIDVANERARTRGCRQRLTALPGEGHWIVVDAVGEPCS